MPFKDFSLETLTSSDVNTYWMQQVIIQCTSGTRPGSPSEGWHIWETDTGLLRVFKSGSWQIAVNHEYTTRKTSDEAYSAGTLHNDSELLIPMLANRTYFMESWFHTTGTSSGHNFIFTWTVPSGTTMTYASNHPVNGPADVVNSRIFAASDTINAWVSASLVDTTVTTARGVVKTSSTTGNLQFRWRNGTGTTTLYSNSYIRLSVLS